MSPAQTKGGFLANIRNQKWSVPVGMAITALLSLLLLLYTASWLCFAPILIALVMYFLPVFFGLKDKKKIAVFGIVLLLVLSIAYGVFQASALQSMTAPNMSSGDSVLTNGTVTPIISNGPGTPLNFTVQVKDAISTSLVNVYLIQWPLGGTLLNLSMNYVGPMPGSSNYSLYQLTVSNLSAGIYEFAYWTTATNKQIYSSASWGPVYADSGTVLTTSLYGGFLQVFIFTFIAPLFFVFLAMMWWMDRSRVKMEEKMKKNPPMAPKAKPGEKEKFICSECGADVPAEANECPQCGEKFDEEQKKDAQVAKVADGELRCPKCNNVVFNTDTKCWNCGQELIKK
ncbi:MAG: zinc ribbon domain-containing protein [Methanomassiliicoccales archaeon]